MNPIIATFVRAGLMAAAGVLSHRYGVEVGADAIDALTAGACAALALGWSIYEKRRAK
jgi:hypothetical protein